MNQLTTVNIAISGLFSFRMQGRPMQSAIIINVITQLADIHNMNFIPQQLAHPKDLWVRILVAML